MRTISENTAREKAKGIIALHDVCPHCGRKLNRRTVVLFGKPHTVTDYGSCGCQESMRDGEPPELADKLKYIRAGIPTRYLMADYGSNGWDEAVLAGTSLYVCGTYGTGKSQFAADVAKAIIDSGTSVRFENSKHLLTEIQRSYDGERTDALDRAYSCGVLVLDDLGKEQPTEYSISMLYEIIDSRYSDCRPIIATSNFERDELLERLSRRDRATAESIVSRLCDGVSVIRINGDDRRLA